MSIIHWQCAMRFSSFVFRTFHFLTITFLRINSDERKIILSVFNYFTMFISLRLNTANDQTQLFFLFNIQGCSIDTAAE